MIISLVLSCSLLAPAARAQSPASPSDADAIIALEKERAAALVRGDMDKLKSTTPDDYTVIDTHGKLMSARDVMEALRSGNLKLENDDLDELNVRVYGDAAVLTGRATVKGRSRGKSIARQERFSRVYIKRNGSWVGVAYQTTPIAK